MKGRWHRRDEGIREGVNSGRSQGKKGGERLIDIKIIQLYIQARGRRRG